MTHAFTDVDYTLGALELSILNAYAEADRVYQTERKGRILYVVDTDVFLLYANPQLTNNFLWITALLDTPENPSDASAANARLGLGEVLGRFIFSDEFAAQPRFILNGIDEELFDVEKFSERQSAFELEKLAQQMESGRTQFAALVDKFFSSNKDAEEFVKEAADRISATLSVLYGDYNGIRQYRRISALLNRKETGTLRLLEKVTQFGDVLSQARAKATVDGVAHDPPELAAWKKAFEKTKPSSFDNDDAAKQASRLERLHRDAEMAWSIECINTWLECEGKNVRVVWLTSSSRVYSSALRKFNLDRSRLNFDKASNKPSGDEGSHLRRFDYLSQISPYASFDNTEVLSDRSKLARHLPLRDPRMLLAMPEYLDFGTSTDDPSDTPITRSIPEWLPVLLEPHLRQWKDHGGKLGAANTWRELIALRSASTRATDLLTPAAVATLKSNFSDFIKQATLRAAFERGIRHKVMLDIKNVFKGENPDSVVIRRIDSTLAELFDDLSDEGLSAAHLSGPPVGWVPPLVVSSFGQTETVWAKIISKLSDNGFEAVNASKLMRSEIQNLIDNKFYIEDLSDNSVTNRYLSLLSRAVMFGVTGNWTASRILAKQAYLIASHETKKMSASKFSATTGIVGVDTRISGREAAYWAAISARRSMGHSPVFRSQEARKYLRELSSCLVQQELPYLKKNNREAEFPVHMLRHASEALALELTLALYHKWCPEDMKGAIDSVNSFTEFSAKYTKLNKELVAISLPAHSTPGLQAAYYYLCKQIGSNLLFVLMLSDEDNINTIDDELFKNILQSFADCDAVGQASYSHAATRPTLFDRAVVACAKKRTNTQLTYSDKDLIVAALTKKIDHPDKAGFPFETERWKWLKNQLETP